MPKISSKNKIDIRSKSVEKTFLIDVHYNKDMKFYAQVPSGFFDHFDQMDDSKRDEFNAGKNHLSKNNFDKVKFAIKGASEEECLTNMENFLSYAIDMIATRRNVIVLDYHGKKIPNYSARRRNADHPHVELSISLLYCTEVSTGADNKTYAIFSERESGEGREDIELDRRVTIIDDTEENRRFVEDVYSKLDSLNQALIKFTQTPETLMQLIEGKQKLLG